ncbi:Alpha/beta hydrolase family protein [Planctomycetes bacterium Poly30]|uniref:Alpha/beta hydrolase family protein n=1 Tax=Saltatorellus ferox TaxID=2528018 RepID=A0A518EXB1_9BACT|nr:Alpha/beta hydrolase family protein [Planctomycetes bacterium Poly30]
MAKREELKIVVPHQGVEHVAARLDLPGGDPVGVYVMAHGAGAPMTSDFMEAAAPRIADAAALAVVRFNYAYAEKMSRTSSRLPPEPRRALEVIHRTVLQWTRDRFPHLPLVGGGKSLGGRIASLMAAEAEPMDGLVFLGYPLHPPGKPEKLRTEHFPKLDLPMLFLQGDRDALADLDLLRPALEALPRKAALHVVAGGDHSFSVLKRSGRTPEEVLDEIASAVADWSAKSLPGRSQA